MSNIKIQKIGITKLNADSIVNAANEQLAAGGGVCGAVFSEAGYKELTKACQAIGFCKTGSAVITPGFGLPAKYIIHAVGPVWHGGNKKEPQLLYSCYQKSLELAIENGCHSIGFPLISAGIFGYPKDLAWRKAIQACNDFICRNAGYELEIIFCVLDNTSMEMGQIILDEICSNAVQSDVQVCNPFTKEQKFTFFYHENEENGCFSNWFYSVFYVNGIKFTSVEQYLMYQKTVTFCDEETAVKILETDEPSMIKYLGRMVKNYQDCLWAGKRQLVLYDGLMAKFGQNQKLRKKLLATEETIMAECSVNDKIWGIGISMDDIRRFDLSEWVGINLLGNTLMLVRRELKEQEYIKPAIDNKVYWFEMEKDKSVTLVKPNGERKNYPENNLHFNRTKQMLAGWQRANLYLMEENIWDSTAFGASMSAILGFYWKNIEGIPTALLFSTPQNAESAIYPYLSKRQVKQCRENVKAFYSSKEAQQAWHDLVLYPVCLMTKRGSNTLIPVSMKALYESGIYGFELTEARPVFISELQQFFEGSI